MDAAIGWEGVPAAVSGPLEAVIFLDVDGVLHPLTAGDAVETEADLPRLLTCTPVLEAALAACAEEPGLACRPALVLSSTWRRAVHWTEGGPSVAAAASRRRALKCSRLLSTVQLSSKTPAAATPDRACEVRAWVARFFPRRWVVLDDEPAHLAGIPNTHVVYTDPQTGLTPSDVARVVAKLRAQGEAAATKQ